MRCERSLGRNSEIRHLTVGRRIAFDTSKGRLWVICTHCDQWNLVPIEERWEAAEECDRTATTAEATASSTKLGIAQTETGLELLRVGGLDHADIANCRYGRRLVQRQRLLFWLAASFVALAIALGARADFETGSLDLGVYVGIASLAWLASVWRHPPSLAPTLVRIDGERIWIWPWQVDEIYIESDDQDSPPAVVLPGQAARRLGGLKAARFLGALLPKLNGADCVTASVHAAAKRVAHFEKQEHSHADSIERRGRKTRNKKTHRERVLRPWERLAASEDRVSLVRITPERRLALEMAVTEEIEQHELTQEAAVVGEDWTEQENIAAIADDLVVPPEVEERLREARANRASRVEAGASKSDA
jgi:hypothetical protein